MAQPTDLSLNAPNDLRMAVADGRREDSAEEVQVLPAIDAPYPDAFTFLQNQWFVIERPDGRE
tara:strand:+ start:629 stop:817 length:189 start_codon:yes stop_codon:yes gene_type:complete